jgi:hypothetical protein
MQPARFLSLLLLCSTSAWAEGLDDPDGHMDDDPPEAEDEGEDPEGDAEPADDGTPEALSTGLPTDAAIAAPELNPEQHKWLRPLRQKLPQHPYAQTDFTAYTLEWGEVKVGVTAISLGILPRVQLGTTPILALAGVANGTAKVNLVRIGPLDLAGEAGLYDMTVDAFHASYSWVGVQSSLILAEPWSLHTSAQWTMIEATGLPDLTRFSPILMTVDEATLEQLTAEAKARNIQLDVQAEALRIRAATDVRFNRRDSLVIQFSALVWQDVKAGVDNLDDLPPILGLDEVLKMDAVGEVPISESYVASISYQAAWKQLEARVGLGMSAVPSVWLMQSMELSYRFGGKTRSEEHRMRKTWRRNKQDLG